MDAVVLIGGCAKTVPAQLMGAASAGIPAIQIFTGPMMTGRHKGAAGFLHGLPWLLGEVSGSPDRFGTGAHAPVGLSKRNDVTANARPTKSMA
jgi:hypothetical protein